MNPEEVTRENVFRFIAEEQCKEIDRALEVLAEPIEVAGVRIVTDLALLSVDERDKHWLYVEADEAGVDLSMEMVRALETIGGAQQLYLQEVYPELLDIDKK